MNIIISNADMRPIYRQVYDGIKSAVISGELTQGQMLPSIRLLAKELKISVITTKRAYDELEQDGYINTVAGKGCFVAPKNTELIKENHLLLIEEYVDKIIDLAAPLKLTDDELIKLFNNILKGAKDNERN